MEKYQRDGMVAVLYSPDYGAGWSTWNPDYPDMVWDPGMVELILEDRREEMMTYAMLKWPDAYFGGLDNLTVAWVHVGERFIVDEYDGSESITRERDMSWTIA